MLYSSWYKMSTRRVKAPLRYCSVCFHLSTTFFCPSLSALSLAAMAHSIPHGHTRPIGSYNDPFGDGAYDEPVSTGSFNYDDTKTFAAHTSGVAARDPAKSNPLAGPTEAESLAADYRHSNASPSLSERPGRFPTPSPHDSTLLNPSDIMGSVPYRDDDSSLSHRPPSVLGKSNASLVHNAADMGQSSSYQDLGMYHPPWYICNYTHMLRKNTRNPRVKIQTPCQKRGLLSEAF